MVANLLALVWLRSQTGWTPREGHHAIISALAARGEVVLSGDYAGRIVKWSLADHREEGMVKIPTSGKYNGIEQIAILPDGQEACVVNGQGDVTILNLQTAATRRTMTLGPSGSWDGSWKLAPDGRTLCRFEEAEMDFGLRGPDYKPKPGFVRLIDTRTGLEKAKIAQPYPHGRIAMDAGFQKGVIVGWRDVVEFDFDSGKLGKPWSYAKEDTTVLADSFAYDGKRGQFYLVQDLPKPTTAPRFGDKRRDHAVRCFDLRKGFAQKWEVVPDFGPYHLRILPNGDLVNESGEVYDGNGHTVFQCHSIPPIALAEGGGYWVPDHGSLWRWANSRDVTFKLLGRDDETVARQSAPVATPTPILQTESIREAEFDRQAVHAVSTTNTGFDLWDLRSKALLAKVPLENTRYAYFLPDGKSLGVVTDDSVLRYDVATLTVEKRTPIGWPTMAASDRGGDLYLLFGSSIQQFDVATGRAVKSWPLPLQGERLRVSEDGLRMVVVSTGPDSLSNAPKSRVQQVVVLDRSGKTLSRWNLPGRQVNEEILSPDGKYLGLETLPAGKNPSFQKTEIAVYLTSTGKRVWAPSARYGYPVGPFAFDARGVAFAYGWRVDKNLDEWTSKSCSVRLPDSSDAPVVEKLALESGSLRLYPSGSELGAFPEGSSLISDTEREKSAFVPGAPVLVLKGFGATLLDLRTGQTLPSHWHDTISPGARYRIEANEDSDLVVRDLLSGTEIMRFPRPDPKVRYYRHHFVESADGRYLALLQKPVPDPLPFRAPLQQPAPDTKPLRPILVGLDLTTRKAWTQPLGEVDNDYSVDLKMVDGALEVKTSGKDFKPLSDRWIAPADGHEVASRMVPEPKVSFNPYSKEFTRMGVKIPVQLPEGWAPGYFSGSGVEARYFDSDARCLVKLELERSASKITKLGIYEVATGKLLRTFDEVPSDIGSAEVSSDGRRAFTVQSDGTARYWDLSGVQPPVTFVLGKEAGDYLAYLPSGEYMATGKAATLVAVKIGDRAFPFDLFPALNRPDKVLRALGAADEETLKLVESALVARGTDVKRPFAWPSRFARVEIVDRSSIPLSTPKTELALSIKASPEVKRVRVWINGVESAPGRAPGQMAVTLAPGPNSIEVGGDAGELGALRDRIDVYCAAPPRPTLRILAVGVSDYAEPSMSLRSAARDAESVANALAASKGYQAVDKAIVLDRNATTKGVRSALAHLGQAKPEDTVVIFLAGHGFLRADGEYCFAPYDADFKQGVGIPYRDLSAALKACPARQRLVLLDSCHAGRREGVDQPLGPPGSNASRTATQNHRAEAARVDRLWDFFLNWDRDAGANVIAASSAESVAYESGEHGYFTQALLELIGKPNEEIEKVTANDFRTGIEERISELSQGRQRPSTRSLNLANDFVVFRFK